jgi:hypothetical protein
MPMRSAFRARHRVGTIRQSGRCSADVGKLCRASRCAEGGSVLGRTGRDQRRLRPWIAFASGRKDEGVQLMRGAADADATDKAAISPGPIAPARELLGEMLLEPATRRKRWWLSRRR